MNVGGVCVLVTPALVPNLLDYFFPFDNQTRDELYILDGEYPFDKHKHYYLVYLIEAVLALVTIPMFTGVDTTFVGCVQHGVAMINVLK